MKGGRRHGKTGATLTWRWAKRNPTPVWVSNTSSHTNPHEPAQDRKESKDARHSCSVDPAKSTTEEQSAKERESAPSNQRKMTITNGSTHASLLYQNLPKIESAKASGAIAMETFGDARSMSKTLKKLRKALTSVSSSSSFVSSVVPCFSSVTRGAGRQHSLFGKARTARRPIGRRKSIGLGYRDKDLALPLLLLLPIAMHQDATIDA